jgi:hypothetical protein
LKPITAYNKFDNLIKKLKSNKDDSDAGSNIGTRIGLDKKAG